MLNWLLLPHSNSVVRVLPSGQRNNELSLAIHSWSFYWVEKGSYVSLTIKDTCLGELLLKYPSFLFPRLNFTFIEFETRLKGPVYQIG